MTSVLKAGNAMAVAPHFLAAQAARDVMKEGGNAIEAMVAAAATIAMVYPHMTGLGGDAFWLIHEPGHQPVAIDASGGAAAGLTPSFYTSRGLHSIPVRGPLAANTIAGTVSGWERALEISKLSWGGRLPLSRLFADAIHHAEHGVAVTASQMRSTATKLPELAQQPGFSKCFLSDDKPPAQHSLFFLPRMAALLRHLARTGLDDFYRGELAQTIAADLAAIGSPVALADLNGYRAEQVEPLALAHSLGTIYNLPPPTQGAVSLMILGILDRLHLDKIEPDSADYVHCVVEATKLAFRIRDTEITDPRYMRYAAQDFLKTEFLTPIANAVRPDRALPWGKGRGPGDTVWMGVIDREGRAVSFIQSIYHEFGSGVVLEQSGLNWQNRGCTFSLDENALNGLKPGRKPFHTLNPALARLHDGRVMVYGTMGGDGQPQTQAAVFTRAIVYGQSLQQAVSAPRWLLGRTWGLPSDTLKLESRFSADIVESLRQRGHEIEMLQDYDEAAGHAGAIILNTDGTLQGAYDPRSDGGVAMVE
ncbi:MAG: gamma-glutamyltransferase family protein [Gallionella sp.]|nr:gamma-glutamyltransferase family protein [Gallionella sp.]